MLTFYRSQFLFLFLTWLVVCKLLFVWLTLALASTFLSFPDLLEKCIQLRERNRHNKLICSRIQQLARGTTFRTLNFKRAEVRCQDTVAELLLLLNPSWPNHSSGNWETVSAFVMSDSAGCNNWTGPEFLATLETVMLILRLGTINDWHSARPSLFGPKVGFI